MPETKPSTPPLVRQSPRLAMPVPPEPKDEELCLRAREGSRVAFEALVRRHQKPVYFMCLRYVNDHDVAADLAQRTFIRVMGKVGELGEVQTFKSWLYRIAANLSLNHLRDSARFVDEGGMPPERAVPPEALSRLETSEEADALRRAVARLPTKQRMTLELRIYDELSFRDIALALDTTEGAAKVNFHYAIRRMRELLSKPMGGRLGEEG
jgi:RNA polymerase sigma-70 factor (ECF subfamily)